VGAYGQEVSGVITSVRAYDLAESRIVDLTAAECGFGYRSSVFNTTARGRYLILGVRYALERNRLPDLAYPDLARRFADRTHPPSLTDVRAAVRAIRASKAMLLVDGDPDCRSAGSFFRNPMVSADEVDAVSRVAREQVPSFASEPGRSKVPAAWLIERAGFGKGTARGAAGLSGKHALALINRGGASAMDILRLAGEIQTGVQDRFGVRLVPEPVFVGFPADVVDRHGALSPA
jgi:UDP-N-acetylmuramate dehydrogenase